jgi:hypothetical protein
MDKSETERCENSAAEWLRVRLGGFSVSHMMAARKASPQRTREPMGYVAPEKPTADENQVEICRMEESTFYGQACVKSKFAHSS